MQFATNMSGGLCMINKNHITMCLLSLVAWNMLYIIRSFLPENSMGNTTTYSYENKNSSNGKNKYISLFKCIL